MILTKEVEIEKTENLSSDYIESKLEKLGFDVLKWAIVKVKDDSYIVDIAIIQ